MQADRGVNGPMKYKSFVSAAKAVYDRYDLKAVYMSVPTRQAVYVTYHLTAVYKMFVPTAKAMYDLKITTSRA